MSESLSSLDMAYDEFEKTVNYFFNRLYVEDLPFQEDSSDDKSLVQYIKNSQEKEFYSSGSYPEGSTNTGGIQLNYYPQLTTLISDIINQIINFLKKIIENWSNQVLPDFFDIFLSILLNFAKKHKKDPIFSLNSIYMFFTLLGMGNIHVKTFRMISGAIQWGICSTKWINIPFWENYLKTPPSDIHPDTIKTIQNMVKTAKIMEEDNLRIAKSQAEFYK